MVTPNRRSAGRRSFGSIATINLAAWASLGAASVFAQSQTSTWRGGGGNSDWSVAANWSPNGVPNNGTNGISDYDVVVGAPLPTDLDINSTIDSLMIDAPGELDDTGFSLNVLGTLTNVGTINGYGTISGAVVNSGTVNTPVNSLDIVSPSVTNTNLLEATGVGTLTFGSGASIDNAGGQIVASIGTETAQNAIVSFAATVNLSGGSLNNSNGHVIADAGTVTFSGIVNTTASITLTGVSINNAGGEMIANGPTVDDLGGIFNDPTPSAAITVNDGTIDNTGGQIVANGGTGTGSGIISTTSAIDLNGVAVNNSGGLIAANGAGTTNKVVTITSTATIALSNGASVVGGTISVTGGSISVVNSNGLDSSDKIVTLDGVTLSSGTNLGVTGGDTLDIGSAVLTNNGTIGASGGTLNFNGSTLAGNGMIVLDSGETITGQLTQSAQHTITNQLGDCTISATMTNYGTITNFNGYTNQITISGPLINYGTVSAYGGPIFINGLTTNYGTLATGVGALTTANGALTNLSGQTLTGGTYQVGGTLNLPGSVVTNQANIVLSGGTFTAIAPLAINEGSFEVNDVATFTTQGAFTNSGTLTLTNRSTFTSSGDFSNSGIVTLIPDGTFAPAGTLAVNGTYRQTAGLTLLDGGLNIVGNGEVELLGGTIESDSTIEGSGTIEGSIDNSGGIVHAAGNLVVNPGSYKQGPSGQLDIDISADDLGLYSILFVGGNADLDGTLVVSFVDGFIPAVGDTITFVTTSNPFVLTATGTISGQFDTVDSPYPVQISYSPTNVSLTVVPEPMAIGVVCFAALMLSRPKRKVGGVAV